MYDSDQLSEEWVGSKRVRGGRRDQRPWGPGHHEGDGAEAEEASWRALKNVAGSRSSTWRRPPVLFIVGDGRPSMPLDVLATPSPLPAHTRPAPPPLSTSDCLQTSVTPSTAALGETRRRLSGHMSSSEWGQAQGLSAPQIRFSRRGPGRPWSLAKRLRMRPVGLAPKNHRGAATTARSISLWRAVPARRVTAKNSHDRTTPWAPADPLYASPPPLLVCVHGDG